MGAALRIVREIPDDLSEPIDMGRLSTLLASMIKTGQFEADHFKNGQVFDSSTETDVLKRRMSKFRKDWSNFNVDDARADILSLNRPDLGSYHFKVIRDMWIESVSIGDWLSRPLDHLRSAPLMKEFAQRKPRRRLLFECICLILLTS